MSSNDIPELGSKISLISNADIRYEGKLYSVDPQECTIALSSVRSFGTEDRKVTNRVLAQSQIYDFILFRATDIKDISVVPSTHLLYDPAIVQLSGPSAMAGRPFGGIGGSNSLDSSGGGGGPGGGDFGGPTGGRQMGPIGAPPSSSMNHQFGAAGGSGGAAPGGGAGPIGSGGGSGGNYSAMQSGLLHSLTRPSPKTILDMLTGSRNSPPNMNKKPSPIDQQNARSNSRKSFSSADVPSDDGMMNRSHQDKSRKGRNDQQQGYNNQNNHQQQGYNNQNNRPRYNQNQQQQQPMRNHVGTGRPQQNHHQQQQQQSNPNSSWNQHRGGSGGGMGQQQNSVGGGHQQLRMRGPRNNTGGVGGGGPRPNYNNSRPGGGGGGGGGGPNRVKPQPLKFESDYDFDKANTEFEELRSELSKIKIDAPTTLPVANGDDSTKNGEWSAANATANNDAGAVIGDDATAASDPQYFYNKNKSFFDNISCEAVERSKGTQKTDWRKERKLNTETFGVASSRRNNYYRNNQRGPGGYGYGYGGGFRQYQQFFKRHIQQPPQRPTQPQAANA